MNLADAVHGAETALSVLKVLEPVAKDVVGWFEGGAEPAAFADYPSELKSVAALERARYRARKGLLP